MSGLPKVAICELFGVSRQSYYRKKWRAAQIKDRATEVVESVEKIRAEMPRVGCRKLYYMLKPQMRSLSVGRDKMYSILRANHMLVSPVRSYHVTTNSHHRFRKHKNLVEGMDIVRPEQVWVSDITYIGGRDKHMYLALVTDAYSKKIVGYDLSESLNTEGALRALKMAQASRVYKDEPLIHHSDRGIQYCSDSYQDKLAKYGITTSMTESYDPYANAVAERINGILKQEFLLEEINLPLKDMKLVVRDAINTYNRVRPHYSCGYLTPCQMHDQREVKVKTYKKEDHCSPRAAMIF